jgi:hypothetical protein
LLHADDTIQRMRKAVEQCTLDQSGTHPFHLKAVLAPSQERDKDSGRTGEVEIWWKAPDQWRRELRSPDFHRIEIVSGGHQWQKNEGDYFPEWLRETAEELVRPVVLSNDVLAEMNGGDEKRLMGGTYLSWTILSTNGQTQSGMGAGIAIRDDSGLLYTANGFGFSGWFKDYSKFHNRMVARAVSVGSPEVTARVVTLEDLGTVQGGWFDAGQPGGDAQPVDTVLMEEFVARGHLAGDERFRWPAVKDGPLEGALTAEVTIDREGKVREIGPVVSTNPGMSDAGRDQIAALRFSPFTKAGTPVQVHSRITVAFKTTRPEGAEAFFSAQSYFEKARRQDYPSGGAGFPYVLKALFQARSSAGATDTGHYEDTWLEPGMWRREATFGASHVVRSRIGSKLYEVEEGPDVQLLLQIFKLTEPIPVADSLVESDWRIKSDIVDDARTIRVVSGYESADGKLDPEQARGYWFDTNGNLVKMYFPGMGVRLSNFADFQHVHVAQQIDVFHDSDPAMHIHITGVIPANDMLPKTVFEMKGHEVSKLYDSEAR